MSEWSCRHPQMKLKHHACSTIILPGPLTMKATCSDNVPAHLCSHRAEYNHQYDCINSSGKVSDQWKKARVTPVRNSGRWHNSSEQLWTDVVLSKRFLSELFTTDFHIIYIHVKLTTYLYSTYIASSPDFPQLFVAYRTRLPFEIHWFRNYLEGRIQLYSTIWELDINTEVE